MLKSTISEVYIGTNWGFVFVADTKYLRPIASFRPFTEDVRSFWVFRQIQTFSTMLNLATAAGNVSSSDADSDSGSVKTSGSVGSQNVKGESQVPAEDNKDAAAKIDDSRGGSPLPTGGSSSSGFKNPNSSPVTNSQLLIGIGKGFSNLIDKNVAFGKSEVKQRRRAFALLWHVKGSWE